MATTVDSSAPAPALDLFEKFQAVQKELKSQGAPFSVTISTTAIIINSPDTPEHIALRIVKECTARLRRIPEVEVFLPSRLETPLDKAIYLGKLIGKKRTDKKQRIRCFHDLGELWEQHLTSAEEKELSTALGWNAPTKSTRKKMAKRFYRLYRACGVEYIGQASEVSPAALSRLPEDCIENMIEAIQLYHLTTATSSPLIEESQLPTDDPPLSLISEIPIDFESILSSLTPV
jgi:hypothetical protein